MSHRDTEQMNRATVTDEQIERALADARALLVELETWHANDAGDRAIRILRCLAVAAIPAADPVVWTKDTIRKELKRRESIGELVVHHTYDDAGLSVDEYVELIEGFLCATPQDSAALREALADARKLLTELETWHGNDAGDRAIRILRCLAAAAIPAEPVADVKHCDGQLCYYHGCQMLPGCVQNNALATPQNSAALREGAVFAGRYDGIFGDTEIHAVAIVENGRPQWCAGRHNVKDGDYLYTIALSPEGTL